MVLSFVTGENAKWPSPSEDTLTISYKAKQTYASHTTVEFQVKNLYIHKNVHTNFYSSFIHNCPILQAMKMSFNRWMGEKNWYIKTMECHPVIKMYEATNKYEQTLNVDH
jgi:hypothetical protein